MTKDQKIWLITGVSRGLGKALAQAVLDNGDIVIGTTRNGKADLNGDANTLKLFELELTTRRRLNRQWKRLISYMGAWTRSLTMLDMAC